MEIIQNNIGIANDCRMELRKQLLAIATAIFAFTVSLFPQHQAADTAESGSPCVEFNNVNLALIV